MATLNEEALQAEIQKLDAEGREAERRLRDLEYKEKNADGKGRGGIRTKRPREDDPKNRPTGRDDRFDKIERRMGEATRGGFERRGGGRGGGRFGGDRGEGRFGDRGGDRAEGRFGDRLGDRGEGRFGDRGGDRGEGRFGDRGGDRGEGRFGDRGAERGGERRGGDRYNNGERGDRMDRYRPHDEDKRHAAEETWSAPTQLSSAVVKVGGDKIGIEKPTPKEAPPEVKQRNKRVFGMLLGHLQQFKKETEEKTEVDHKREEILHKVETQIEEEHTAIVEQQKKQIAEQKEEQKALAESIRKKQEDMEMQLLEGKWAKYRESLTKFHKTHTKPRLFFALSPNAPAIEISDPPASPFPPPPKSPKKETKKDEKDEDMDEKEKGEENGEKGRKGKDRKGKETEGYSSSESESENEKNDKSEKGDKDEEMKD